MNRRMLAKALVFCLLVALGVGSRLVKEVSDLVPWNFNAVTAAALFAGFYFRSRKAALCVPLLIMLLSDLVIGGYQMEVMLTVYAAMLLPIAWGSLLRSRLTAPRVGLTAVGSTLIFYLATNLAVWHAMGSYPRTLAGLATCYAAAVPFLVYQLCGDLVFATALFGGYAVLKSIAESRAMPAAALASVATAG